VTTRLSRAPGSPCPNRRRSVPRARSATPPEKSPTCLQDWRTILRLIEMERVVCAHALGGPPRPGRGRSHRRAQPPLARRAALQQPPKDQDEAGRGLGKVGVDAAESDTIPPLRWSRMDRRKTLDPRRPPCRPDRLRGQTGGAPSLPPEPLMQNFSPRPFPASSFWPSISIRSASSPRDSGARRSGTGCRPAFTLRSNA